MAKWLPAIQRLKTCDRILVLHTSPVSSSRLNQQAVDPVRSPMDHQPAKWEQLQVFAHLGYSCSGSSSLEPQPSGCQQRISPTERQVRTGSLVLFACQNS